MTLDWLQSLLNTVPSIELVSTDNIPRIVSELAVNSGLGEQELASYGKDDETTIEWVKTVLSTFSIYGRFYCSFSFTVPHPRPTIPWMVAELGTDYAWVPQLWRLSRLFAFVPMDTSYFMQIIWDEHRYLALKSRKEDIQAALILRGKPLPEE